MDCDFSKKNCVPITCMVSLPAVKLIMRYFFGTNDLYNIKVCVCVCTVQLYEDQFGF